MGERRIALGQDALIQICESLGFDPNDTYRVLIDIRPDRLVDVWVQTGRRMDHNDKGEIVALKILTDEMGEI